MAVQINVQASQAALVSSIQAGVNAYNQKFANQNQLNLKINASGFSQPLGRITGNVKDFEAALAASNARVIAFGASTAVLGGVIRGFKELANVTIEIEKSLTDINRVFGLSTAQLQKFSSSLFDVSKQTSSSFNDAAQAALEFSRQGLKVEEVLKRTNDALLLSKIAGMSTAASIETLTASVNGFKESGITTTQLLNKLVAVEQNYAVSAGDLAEALSRTGQAAQEAGVGIDELNALVTSAQEKTARGGAVIGNALKTIFTRLQRSDTLDQLEQFNIAVRDIQGNMLPAMTILQNFAGVYKGLADSQRAQLSEQVAGVNQINILKAIIGDLSDKQSVYSRAVVDGANATNEASVAAAKLNQTLDALLSQTATVGQQFANNVGKVTFAPLAKETLGVFKSMFEGLNEVLEGEGLGSTFANGFLKGIRNLIAGPGSIAAFYTLFQLIKNSFTYVAQALPQIAGITTETQNRKNIESAILQIMQEQGVLSRALAGNMGNEAAQAQLLLNAARARTAQMQQELTLAQSLAKTLAGQGVIVKSTGGLTATRSGGYIPASTQVAEIAGAKAGGYQPGRVVPSPVGGVMNTAETVKYVPGFAQPFINPPANSKAGMMHRQNSISTTGVDPYANMGFIPNFSIKGLFRKGYGENKDQLSLLAGRIFESLLRRDNYIDLTENRVTPDIDKGPYAIREAKLSGETAYRDNNLGIGKPKGTKLALPLTAIKDYDERLQNKGINIKRLGYTHQFLFSKARSILNREENQNTDPSHISLFSGFIPNFARRNPPGWNVWSEEQKNAYRERLAAEIQAKDLVKSSQAITSNPGQSLKLQEFNKQQVAKADIARFSKYGYNTIKIPFIDPSIAQGRILKYEDFITDPKTGKKFPNASVEFGDRYERFVEPILRGMFPGYITSIEAGLFGARGVTSKQATSRVDGIRFDDPTNSLDLFEIKAGKPENLNYGEINEKFRDALIGAPKALIQRAKDRQINKYLILNALAAKGFIPNFAKLYGFPPLNKGFALQDGNIFNAADHSFAEELISAERIKNPNLSLRGNIRYAYDSAKSILRYMPIRTPLSEKLKQAFQTVSGKNINFQDVADINTANIAQEQAAVNSIIAKASENAIDIGSGYKAIYNPRTKEYERLIRGNQYYDTKYMGITPEYLGKFAGGVDGWIAFNENVYKKKIDWKTLSKGFIPNFAYKQSVMNLEQNLSGNKAIFDTQPFPHIRNASQPTFASAIADHGGLNNALSDSMRNQKAAGLMNKGFVPNFADFDIRGTPLSTSQGKVVSHVKINAAINSYIKSIDLLTTDNKKISDAITKLLPQFNLNQQSFNEVRRAAIDHAKAEKQAAQQTTQQATQQTSSKNKERLDKFLNTALFAAPMIAGQLESAYFGNRKRTEMTAAERGIQSGLSVGLTSVSTGASIGNMILPGWGGAIGAAVGGLVGLTSALNATKLSAEELSELNQEQTQKAQANISAASAYIDAQKSLTEMIAQGASSSDIEMATSKLSDGFKQISDVKLQEIFNATGGNVAEMTKQLQKYTNETTRKSAFKTALVSGKNVEETISGYNVSLNEEQKKNLITGLRGIKGAKEKGFEEEIKNARIGAMAGGTGGVVPTGDLGKKVFISGIVETLLKAQGYTEANEPEYESMLKAGIDKLFNFSEKQLNNLANSLEKSDLSSRSAKAITNFITVSTKSFNQIFQDIEEKIKIAAYEIALEFEKSSSTRRIQSSILEFSMNFQDSLNSFLSNNLPDARKFDFAAATAAQKAQMQLQKNQQDYDKLVADQAKERADMLNKNAKDLSESFKSALLKAEVNAEYFNQKIFPEIQKGTFKGNTESILKEMKGSTIKSIEDQLKIVNEQFPNRFSTYNLENKGNIDSALTKVKEVIDMVSEGAEPDEYNNLIKLQQSLVQLQKQNSLYQSETERKKLDNILNDAKNEQNLFDLKQANAKREAELNKTLADTKAKIDAEYQIKKSQVDKENMMRLERMKDITSSISNRLEESKAESAARVSTLQRNLEDPRQNYGKGMAEISQRNFSIQKSILTEQRKQEDEAISAEIQQRILEMAAEQENTAATLQLNDTIMQLIETQLKGELGGAGKIEEINGLIKNAGYTPEQINNQFGEQAYSKFETLQRIQESRIASASNNATYNTSTFAAGMQESGFNEKTRAEQLKYLTEQRTKAESAGNIVLAGTIKRYEQQIQAKDKSLQLSREQIDLDIKQKEELDKINFSYKERFKKGFGGLNEQADKILYQLAEDVPSKFADGMTNALMEVAKGTKSIGDAFKDMAINFGQEIMQAVMRAAIGKAIGSAFSGTGIFTSIFSQRGGIIHAQNGMYISGGRTGDKNPAMLEDGEYVLNRNAVAAFGGPRVLDQLNFKQVPRFGRALGFQEGGGFSLYPELKTSNDPMNQLYNNKAVGLMDANNYSAYAYANDEYFVKQREKAIQDEQERVQKAYQSKLKTAQLVSSIVGAAGSVVLARGLGKLSSAQMMGYTSSAISNAKVMGISSSQLKNLQSSGITLNPSGIPNTQRGGLMRFNSGGFVPHGSRLSDTIPALLTGGEYVMNNSAVRKYGLGTMNMMNAGGLQTSNSSSTSSSNTNNTNNNSTNISINVDRNGRAVYGANTTSYETNDIVFSKRMARQINNIVVKSMQEEKRYNGVLYKDPLRT